MGLWWRDLPAPRTWSTHTLEGSARRRGAGLQAGTAPLHKSQPGGVS
jgi:hypothetical protein